ncbi:putative TFIIIC subunit [Lyophyllum shimeji]|uniref:TFIIIC subunit n=1 Tax=Lyophyllum shimeji TaxID=47721 RepID=A0A9P3PVW9_LYOSH|nr:putative TFIIIC subunit [Lyophyllum shimeji]
MNAAAPSLCPGYKQVDAFGPDEEYEDEEEVAYVTLDLGNIEPTLVPSSSTYRLIGLDTPTPFLQLSGTIMKGRHENLLGTELIFTDGKDPHDPHKKAVTHVANTSQRICFNEVRLQPKGTGTGPLPPKGSKGKAKAVEQEYFDLTTEAEAAAQMVDRVTGKNAPRARAGRTPRTKETSPKRTRQTRSAKGKGKGKEKALEGEEEMPPDEGGEDMDVDKESRSS